VPTSGSSVALCANAGTSEPATMAVMSVATSVFFNCLNITTSCLSGISDFDLRDAALFIAEQKAV